MNGPAYVYDYFSGLARRLDGGDKFSAPLARNAAVFYVVAPIGKSGIAFLGDKNKFIGTGKQRIESLREAAGKLEAGVSLAANEETVVLHGYAASAPKATVLAGEGGDVRYDPATGYFTVLVKADMTVPADKSAGDPVRKLTVTLETQVK